MAQFGSEERRLARRNDVHAQGPTILVVDDDPHFLALVHHWLEPRGFRVICTETAAGALAATATRVINVALVDYRLRAEENGLWLAVQLHTERRIPFIVVSGFLNTRVTVHAMRLGAFDVLDKPVTGDSVLSAITHVLSGDPVLPPTKRLHSDLEPILSANEESPPERLARLVLRACEAPRDPKTLARFARAAVVGSSTFRELCALCAVRPRAACDLGRVLRAISLSMPDHSPITSRFSAGDRRTAVGLMRRAGLDPDARPIELHAFLQRQRLVTLPSEFVRALGHLAAHSPLFFPRDK
jgi:ActR/RegA family two-component response regulator